MWFGILGPLLVRDGTSAIAVPAARQRVLLAALLVRPGTAVPADTLAEMMWDGTPPAGAVTTLRSHVMRLRRVLGPAAGARVVTRYPGYLVEAAEDEVDLLRFTRLCREGGTAVRAGAWARAAGTFGEALGLWRGEPLADIPSGNLRGYDPGQPMTAADALAGLLRALGVASQDIPAEEAERAARYRSTLAGRRVLVTLDNAGSAEQVRPLLPGSPACVVVVTSRNSLAGLVARDGAERLDLDALPAEDAVGLLRTLIGARVDADPDAAAELAVQCCRLPLALRVAAELAAGRPAVPLAGLVGELADRHKRLDLLEAGGDLHTSVRTVFSWSYRHLDAAAARAFRLASCRKRDPGRRHGAHRRARLAWPCH